ncbi:MAG: zf-TFIIB domain-containing protein [Chloroflexi bacterium]|nr:zf-TFIIB domain-containing protein [Chloroflexota bacterium]
MKCPVDKSDMIVVEHEKIELDYCLRCSGVWFDSKELELLVSVLNAKGANLSYNELLSPNNAGGTEVRRKCPICGHKMDKVCFGEEPKVLIDSCPLGDGLWFDSGELHQVLQKMGPQKTPTSRDVISFLGNAFQSTHGAGRKE